MNGINRAAEILGNAQNMKVRVELAYNGNCAEAVALYEKAFGIKSEGIMRYKDVPPEDGLAHPKEIENYVMHTWLKMSNDAIGDIGMHDRSPNNKCNYGDGASVAVDLGSTGAVRAAFSVLKEGGEVGAEPEAVFFSECYCEVKDRFGINWILMYN
jgi:PhnB protein